MKMQSEDADQATDRWTAEDELIIVSLAAGHTYQVAGETAGVSAKTVQRRMAETDFAAEVSRRRTETVTQTTSKITEMEPRAVDTLLELLDAEKPSDRLRAAQLILTLGAKRRETEDLVRRLDHLESLITGSAAIGAGW